MNLVDKAIAYIDPIAGIRRSQARQVIQILDSGYSEGGASTRKTSMKGWRWRGGGVREDIEANVGTLRQRSRDLYMNSPVARAALNRIQTNVVGPGLRLRANPDFDTLGIAREDAAIWGRQAQREFALWAESNDCDQVGLNNLYELQQLALLSWLQSGDVFALLPMARTADQPYDLRIHLIEADRICNPGTAPIGMIVREGVEIDKAGRVTAYHIKNSHPLSMSTGNAEGNKWVRIPARGQATGRRNILHLMICERPEQYRGVPMLAPVIESCKQISRYSEAELMAAVVASLYTVFIKSETPDTPFAEARYEDKPANVNTEDHDAPYEYNLGPGAIVGLNPNEDIAVADPKRPNVQFDAFISSVAREIGASINVPSELVLLQFSSSYSASRAALLEAWKGFRMWRSWMANDFCQPLYEEWLIEAILLSRIQAPGFLADPLIRKAWTRAEWHGPAPGQVDPVKETQAAALRVNEGFSTRTRETAELTGGDFEANNAQRAEEERMRQDAGLVSEPVTIAPTPTTADRVRGRFDRSAECGVRPGFPPARE